MGGKLIPLPNGQATAVWLWRKRRGGRRAPGGWRAGWSWSWLELAGEAETQEGAKLDVRDVGEEAREEAMDVGGTDADVPART